MKSNGAKSERWTDEVQILLSAFVEEMSQLDFESATRNDRVESWNNSQQAGGAKCKALGINLFNYWI